MYRKLIVVLAVLGFIACGKETKGNLTITGNIDGLKEGTIFLQKVQDTSLITLDSLIVKGDAHFTFTTTIDEPQVLYIYLDKKDFNDLNDRIDFFAEPGEMTINTSLRRFVSDLKVTGSKNHEELIAFKEFMSKFNTKELTLLQDGIKAQKEADTEKLTEINDKINSYGKSRMRYILNYAFTNNDKEITPYVVTTETFDANIRFLDTIYQQLTPRIMESKYGKQLKVLIEERKLEGVE
ncbi:hypothetical protein IMCC3317_41780 [Kordia antarctica]|uniref:DUF4369 domain-containing protein n=1 Tax=Kordia antarctica TaxID=1218801 RepID=A0A7L4ZPW5_9FLAO|nr:DUF4369 domain-containing protein [Kordia antarctica]QHI38778.1 hypothetical protein IMCC3317_41780 [Kordia antarctica]